MKRFAPRAAADLVGHNPASCLATDCASCAAQWNELGSATLPQYDGPARQSSVASVSAPASAIVRSRLVNLPCLSQLFWATRPQLGAPRPCSREVLDIRPTRAFPGQPDAFVFGSGHISFRIEAIMASLDLMVLALAGAFGPGAQFVAQVLVVRLLSAQNYFAPDQDEVCDFIPASAGFDYFECAPEKDGRPNPMEFCDGDGFGDYGAMPRLSLERFLSVGHTPENFDLDGDCDGTVDDNCCARLECTGDHTPECYK